jgi:hypothetical protein
VTPPTLVRHVILARAASAGWEKLLDVVPPIRSLDATAAATRMGGLPVSLALPCVGASWLSRWSTATIERSVHVGTIPNVMLNNGVAMPIVGFGVYQVPPQETEQAVATAVEVGYRHIDTAASYENEEAVGRAVRSSAIPRSELFLTTRLWIQNPGSSTSSNTTR